MCRTRAILNDREAKCPFFFSHGVNFIRCEGIIPDSVVSVEFYTTGRLPDRKAKETQYRVFCCDKWQNCERASALMRSKYDEDER